MNSKINHKTVRAVLFSVVAVATATIAYGGVPLNNLQGTGGIAFNPLA